MKHFLNVMLKFFKYLLYDVFNFVHEPTVNQMSFFFVWAKYEIFSEKPSYDAINLSVSIWNFSKAKSLLFNV